MKFSYNKLKVLMPLALIALLIIPFIQMVTKFYPEKTSLYGYTDPIVEKPAGLINAFFNKKLQAWAEQQFNSHLGFRASLIRTFNEFNFKIFHETSNSRVQILSTKKHGLYSNLTINSLNDNILNKNVLEKQYQNEAQELLKVQNELAKQGKFFEVVIASSKAYVYPEELGSRYLVGGASNIFERAADFGQILKANGVNVIDSGPLLRELVKKTGIEMHPVPGVHWNFYAGCLIASKILDDSQVLFPDVVKIKCGIDQQVKPSLYTVDTDGYQLLNVWSELGLLKQTTIPSDVITINPEALHPKIVLIGDSFSGQIRSAWDTANIYSSFVMSNYFQTREVRGEDADKAKLPTDDKQTISDQVMSDIAKSNIIVLQMVDYNIARRNYGFADYFINHYASTNKVA